MVMSIDGQAARANRMNIFMKIKIVLVLVFLLGWSAVSLASGLKQPAAAPSELLARIEIPAGSTHKYEIDEATGAIYLDRVMAMPVVYPANYGYLPGTLAGDGDALDVLVLTQQPVHPGVLIRVRPLGYLKMIDGGEADEKVICVPIARVDPHFAGIHSLEDLPEALLQQIEAFFRVYKQLPAGRKLVELDGFGSRDEAMRIIREAMENHHNHSKD